MQTFSLAHTIVTEGFEPNVKWEPFIDLGSVGYKCTRLSDGAVTYVYLNPSDSGTGEPDVFVYMGKANDPAQDDSLHYYTPEF